MSQFIAIMSEAYVQVQKQQLKKQHEKKQALAALSQKGGHSLSALDDDDEVDYDVLSRFLRYLEQLAPQVVLPESMTTLQQVSGTPFPR